MQGTGGRGAWAGTATRRRVGAAVAGALLAAGLLTGCSGSTDPVVSATDATVPAVPSATPTAPAGTDETSAGPAQPTATPTTAAGPTSTTAQATPVTPSPPRTTAPPAPSSTSATEIEGGPGASWPTALGEPRQGDPVWAVYLVTAHSTSAPAIEAAVRQAAGVGYQAVVGDLACDLGAVDALDLDRYDLWSAATLYFATEQDANEFIASYRAEVADVAGYARITLGCLD